MSGVFSAGFSVPVASSGVVPVASLSVSLSASAPFPVSGVATVVSFFCTGVCAAAASLGRWRGRSFSRMALASAVLSLPSTVVSGTTMSGLMPVAWIESPLGV